MLKIRLDKIINTSKVGVFKSINQGLPEHGKYLMPKLLQQKHFTHLKY